MCGIVIQLDGKGKYLKKMLHQIRHRGEKEYYWHYKNLHIGFVRLPIRGLSDEPPYECGDLTGWMVGENYAALNLNDESDTTWTLRRFYHSSDHVRYLNGMYHFVMVNKKQDILKIYTDPYNKKPIYHTTIRDGVELFASEIKALLVHPDIKKDINDYYFRQLKRGERFVKGPETPWKFINYLYPGIESAYEMKKWCSESTIHTESGPPLINKSLTNLIIGAVKYRLMSDRPIGLLLSGGLDSSLIYWIITQVFNYHDFQVIHFENEESDYLQYLDIPSNQITHINLNTFEFDLDDIIRTNESPVDLGSMIPQYLMAKTISEKFPEIKVLITGDGADEIFCGYKRALKSDTREYDMQELIWYHNPRLDKMNARFTLEQRSPYQDYRIIKYVRNIPWEIMRGKSLLKEVAQELNMPEQIINREKLPLKSKFVKEHKKSWQKLVKQIFLKEMINGQHYRY